MNIEKVSEILNKKHNIVHTLGLRLISTDDPDTCEAEMIVGDDVRQPFGFLAGGASLALAETLAGAGSMALRPNCSCVGINVSGNHLKPVAEGETVRAVARVVSKGYKLHVWNVDIYNAGNELVSTSIVTNYIRPLDASK